MTAARHSKRFDKRRVEKWAFITSIFLLVISWAIGGLIKTQVADHQVESFIGEGRTLTHVDEGIFQAEGEGNRLLAVGQGVGYGGQLEVVLEVGDSDSIARVGLLGSRETLDYLNKVVEQGLFDQLLNNDTHSPISVDAVSGATLTSLGVEQAVNNAIGRLGVVTGRELSNDYGQWFAGFQPMDLMALLTFILAVVVSKHKGRHKQLMIKGVRLVSLLLFGVYSAVLFSSSSMGLALGLSWMDGLASYTSLILMLCTYVYLIKTNKNLYCEQICPFGTVQRGLGSLADAKPVTFKSAYALWLPRFLLLAALCLGLIFRSPAYYGYEPFGMVFGFVGSITLFALTVLVMIISVFISRPWCRCFCPIPPGADFIKYGKSYIKREGRNSGKDRSKKSEIKVRLVDRG